MATHSSVLACRIPEMGKPGGLPSVGSHRVGHHWSDLATILYWFRHTSTRVHHGCTCVHHPEPPSHLPPHIISLSHPRAPAPSILYPVSNLDWWFISYIILYMFQCHSSKSSHPLPLPQSPKSHYDLKPIAINLSKHPQAGGGARIWA